MSENPYGVEVGQVWRSRDWRDVYPIKRVVEVDSMKATMIPVRRDDGTSIQGDAAWKKRTRIRLDRFTPNSRGYELLDLSLIHI